MIETTCRYCGKPLMDEARFCAYCGKPADQRKVCPKCGWTTDDDSVYCNECGTLLQEAGAAAERAGQEQRTEAVIAPRILPKPDTQQKVRSGRLLKTATRYSLFQRIELFGSRITVGNLSIYEDRVEFEPKMANIGSALGPIGLVPRSKIKLPVQTYRMEDIADVEVDNVTIYNRLILRMKDGTVVPLAPAVPVSKEPEEIMKLIKLYL